MFIVLGTLMDMALLFLICTPILLPVIKTFGIDPVHFGIPMMVILGIGLIKPPVGSTLFVGFAISGLPMEEVEKGLWPFYIVLIITLAIVIYVPAVTLWIPRASLGWGVIRSAKEALAPSEPSLNTAPRRFPGWVRRRCFGTWIIASEFWGRADAAFRDDDG